MPALKEKVHYFNTPALPSKVTALQKLKAENPDDFRCIVRLGEHNKHKDQNEAGNPYEDEMKAFDNLVKQGDQEKVSSLKVPEEAQKYGLLADTPFTFVDTEEVLMEVVEKLSAAKEIAIDLEHHSVRTYLGITCLMQVSTREEDFVIDTIALKKQLGDALRGVFDNPDIVKVLHGADHDVEWLQRDFSLYIVNMFDTGQAARKLGLR